MVVGVMVKTTKQVLKGKSSSRIESIDVDFQTLLLHIDEIIIRLTKVT